MDFSTSDTFYHDSSSQLRNFSSSNCFRLLTHPCRGPAPRPLGLYPYQHTSTHRLRMASPTLHRGTSFLHHNRSPQMSLNLLFYDMGHQRSSKNIPFHLYHPHRKPDPLVRLQHLHMTRRESAKLLWGLSIPVKINIHKNHHYRSQFDVRLSPSMIIVSLNDESQSIASTCTPPLALLEIWGWTNRNVEGVVIMGRYKILLHENVSLVR